MNLQEQDNILNLNTFIHYQDFFLIRNSLDSRQKKQNSIRKQDKKLQHVKLFNVK